MDRNEMVQTIATQTGLKKADVNRAYDVLSEMVKTSLTGEGEFVLPGLGSLKVRVQKARQARNPRTREVIQVPSKKTVRFSAFKGLKELLNPCCAQPCTPPPPPPPPPSAPSTGSGLY